LRNDLQCNIGSSILICLLLFAGHFNLPFTVAF